MSPLVALSTSASFIADDNALLGTVANIFDLDECQSLCDLHARCGSLVFGNRTCYLYKKTSFAAEVVDDASQSSTPYYTTFETFVSVDQDFVEALDLCIEDQDYPTTPLATRVTTTSKYDCALRCNRNSDCKLFTYDESNHKDCMLYGDEARLAYCSNPSTLTYIMYTTGSFSKAGNLDYAILNEEDTLLSAKIFDRKSLPECAALCDEW